LNILTGLYTGYEIRLRCRMSSSSGVGTNERQSSKDELTLLIGFGFVLSFEIGSENVDRGISKRNFLTVGLLHKHMTA